MSGNNKVAKRWATFPKFTDKELVGIASRSPSVLEFNEEQTSKMLNNGRFVVCWKGVMQPEHADLKLGALCGLTSGSFGSWEIVVRLENGETFRCDNAKVVDIGLLPYVVGARIPDTLDGCETIGRLVGFVEDYNKNICGYLKSVFTGDVIGMKKECLAFVSDIEFGL